MDPSISEHSTDDEDSSYKKLQETKGSSIDGSIIDESDLDNNSSPETETSRDSEVFKLKKKKIVKYFDSDSDSDNDEPPYISQDNGDGNSKQKNTLSSDSEKEIETQIERLQDDHNDENRPATTHIESDSDDPTENQLVIESFSETSKYNVEDTSLQNNSNLLSSCKEGRLSTQFQFNSEDIVNSTAIHSTDLLKTKWRPSNVFRDLERVGESDASSIEIVSDHSSDIIEVSSGDEIASPQETPRKPFRPKIAVRQQTLHSFITATPSKPQIKNSNSSSQPLNTIQENHSEKNIVSRAEYNTQLARANNLEMDFVKLQNMADNLDFEVLPDKGQLIKERLRMAENKLMEAQNKLNNMEPSDDVESKEIPGVPKNIEWEDIQAGANAVLPKTFGKQAMSTYNAQKAVTMDRLQQLHGALQTCPKEEDFEEDPSGIKVPLMAHQRRALAWLLFREKEKPSGGILADDMGLGKTLTMISLVVKSKQLETDSDEENNEKYIGKHTKFNGGTLIVCPASLINQWSGEIERRLKRGLISYYLYHGPKRETKAKILADYDMVITTYSIVNNENDKASALFRVKWRRIILDEAHQIRNHKARTSEACCQLLGKSRWALTGTPMHNKELDMYALLKFLRCTPFDDLQVWKRWVCDKSRGGQERLHTVISSLMLRRTKVELMEKGILTAMPEKKWLLVKVELDKSEEQVYHKVLIFSQTLFAQFLHQRVEKNQHYIDQKFPAMSSDDANKEYVQMREKLLKLNKLKNVSQHEILVLLLRLRQICCHPSLITAMLEEGLEDIGEGDQECEQLNILEQLQKLNLDDEDQHEDKYIPTNDTITSIDKDLKVNLKEAARGHLRASDPVFAKERASSKIRHLLKVLKKDVFSKDDKAIIVSQWSSYLSLISTHLKQCDIDFAQLDGSVPVCKRMDMVDRLNNPKDSLKVLLLSLTAGGVGLNLTGANHLFLLDLHWNPQLENQAQDRIYRVGQTKPVFVYKFLAVDTIEERIKTLQEKKMAMAEGILTGTREVVQNKLSLDDLKMIFNVS